MLVVPSFRAAYLECRNLFTRHIYESRSHDTVNLKQPCSNLTYMRLQSLCRIHISKHPTRAVNEIWNPIDRLEIFQTEVGGSELLSKSGGE